MKYAYIIFSLAIVISSCKSNIEVKPNDILSKEKMVDIIIDMTLYQSSVGIQSKNGKSLDKSHYKDVQFIYEKHNTSDSLFELSMKWYENKPKKLLNIYHMAEAKIGEKQFTKDIEIKDTVNKDLDSSKKIKTSLKIIVPARAPDSLSIETVKNKADIKDTK